MARGSAFVDRLLGFHAKPKAVRRNLRQGKVYSRAFLQGHGMLHTLHFLALLEQAFNENYILFCREPRELDAPDSPSNLPDEGWPPFQGA